MEWKKKKNFICVRLQKIMSGNFSKGLWLEHGGTLYTHFCLLGIGRSKSKPLEKVYWMPKTMQWTMGEVMHSQELLKQDVDCYPYTEFFAFVLKSAIAHGYLAHSYTWLDYSKLERRKLLLKYLLNFIG